MKLEYTEDEFKSIMDLYTRALDLIEFKLKTDRIIALEQEKTRRSNQILESVMAEEDSSEDSEDHPFEVLDGGKEELGPFAEIPFEKKNESKEMSEYARRGKQVFHEFVEMWMVNFCIEGAEQPPRAERSSELTQNYEGRAIIHYMEYLKGKYPDGGLTYAIRDTGLVPNDQIRLVAENMTAVVSACRFTQLASYLEHPDPSKLEDFYV